ncbi:hypothetical protein E1B28_013783 [Marasmius oreades]|uniref:Uncharacterized protein n=1 Tax=Marasmius oreades TaxID=181124 RepID=A0A9P7UND6_9AGAR|nr:uncharacterized protein E1B28_013783 [Marasmius oreades]KAG7087845.1 hypothetical protein E1B28_013783 [Marasmius oreades]
MEDPVTQCIRGITCPRPISMITQICVTRCRTWSKMTTRPTSSKPMNNVSRFKSKIMGDRFASYSLALCLICVAQGYNKRPGSSVCKGRQWRFQKNSLGTVKSIHKTTYYKAYSS